MISLSVVLPTERLSIPARDKTFYFSLSHFKNTVFFPTQLTYVILFRLVLTVNTNYIGK